MKEFLAFFAITTICSGFLLKPVSSGRILALSFFGSKSHKNAFDPLYIELARRGHQVTVIHPAKTGYSSKNIREINGPSWEETRAQIPDYPNMFELRLKNQHGKRPIDPQVGGLLAMACPVYFKMPEVQAVLKEKFDLVFVQSHVNECSYGFLHKLNTSYIFVHPHPMEHYKILSSGNRPLPALDPYYATGHVTNSMDFWQRTANHLSYVYSYILYEYFYIPQIEENYRQYYGADAPSVREIERNASLVFQNAHFSLTYPRSQFPNVVDLACMHCRPGQAVKPRDLGEFVEGSGEEGFIFFSLGSILKGSEMPEEIMRNLIETFGKLKQRVVWKFDLEKIPNLPENVKVVQWAPQQDLLAHKNMRLFISHGGLLSTMEAAYHGVPVIGFPLYGDQHDWNLFQVKVHRFGIPMGLKDLNGSNLLSSIKRILRNQSYANSAKALSLIFKDRQADALPTAVYWSEYVMRHKGAAHLRTPAAQMNAFVYYGLDVISFLGGILIVGIYLIVKIFAWLCCGKGEKKGGEKGKEGVKRGKSKSKKND